jgi:hypothetical protein
MVAPASEALECDSCHAKEGRLAGVAGIYLPGRDGFETTDKVGLAALAVALAGVLFHGGLRIVLGRRRRDDGEE